MTTRQSSAAVRSPDIVAEVSATVSGITGVQLGERQHAMVANRMQKRVSELGLPDLAAYGAYFAAHRDAEITVMLSLLTTHHTYFFREFAHFAYLRDTAIATLASAAKARGGHKLKIWSAACSRGQEAYSLAMLMAEQLPLKAPGMGCDILGTDVDPESVRLARNGVYPRRDIHEIPHSLQNGHWARGTGEIAEFVKAKASLKTQCRFEVGNLLSKDLVANDGPFDIIFCRNVFIYFTVDQVRDIAARLLQRLSPQGMLFVGISESLHGLGLPIKVLGPSIYTLAAPAAVKPLGATAAKAALPAATPAAVPAPPPPAPELLRVLCVDDSASIIALLKRILTPEHGFSIVGTAGNGHLAQRELSRLGKDGVDVMTLDIHMPEQTGPEYLRSNYRPGHPAVVMISSVSRDDTELAGGCLQAGAADFIEKPTMLNFVSSSEEIRLKLRCAYQAQRQAQTQARSPVVSLRGAAPLAGKLPPNCLAIAVASFGDCARLATYLTSRTGDQPPLVILSESADGLLETFGRQLATTARCTVTPFTGTLGAPGSVQIAAAQQGLDKLAPLIAKQPTSILLFTAPAAASSTQLLALSGAQILLEGSLQTLVSPALMRRCSDIVPWTSFAYMSEAFWRTPGSHK